MNEFPFRFFETHHPAECGLEEDFAGTLYTGVIIDGSLYSFDNLNGEWNKSMFKLKDVLNDPDFKPVKYFDNGYVTTDDATYYFCQKYGLELNKTNDDMEM